MFPAGIYAQLMREAGREPAPIIELQHLHEPRPGQRILLYVGSGFRSFRPDEIAAGVVPDGLERPELAQLRDTWALEPVLEFELDTAQHEQISLRLGADQVPRIDLGFYWMRPHHTQ